jgi:FkbM family methyltransferase
MLLERLWRLIRRRFAAATLHVNFKRSATFKLPSAIRLLGEHRNLYLPDENGVKVAFIELLLDDCYGCIDAAASMPDVAHIVDIGANVGLFGIAARRCFPAAKIHAYEPNASLEPYLRVQALAARFEYFLEAVGFDHGTVSLDLHPDSVQTRSRPDALGPVPRIAFRDVVRRIGGVVDLMKIDCEGAEWDLFLDHDAWLGVRRVSMEYHLWPNHKHGEALGNLRALGFAIKQHRPLDTCGLVIAARE